MKWKFVNLRFPFLWHLSFDINCKQVLNVVPFLFFLVTDIISCSFWMKWEFQDTFFQRYQLLVNSSIQFLWKLALLQWNKNFFRLVISEDCHYILLARTRLIKFLHSKSLHYNLVPRKAFKEEPETLVVVFEVDASPSTWPNLKTWHFLFWFKIKKKFKIFFRF